MYWLLVIYVSLEVCLLCWERVREVLESVVRSLILAVMALRKSFDYVRTHSLRSNSVTVDVRSRRTNSVRWDVAGLPSLQRCTARRQQSYSSRMLTAPDGKMWTNLSNT